MGAVYLARGEFEKAHDVLRHALEADAESASEFNAGRSQLLLARALMAKGDRHKAKNLIAQAIATYTESENKRGLSEAFVIYGEFFEEVNQLDAAAKWYRKGIKLDQESEDPIGQAQTVRRLAAVRRQQGDLEEAAECLDEARTLLVAVDDDDTERCQLLLEEGMLALRQLDFETATSRFRQALRMAREDGDERAIAVAMRHLASVQWESGDLSEAERQLREALDMLAGRQDRRERGEILADLGEVLIEQGNRRAALTVLTEAQDIADRMGAVGRRAWATLLMGRAYLQLGERRKANDCLRRAMEDYEDCEDEAGLAHAAYETGLLHAYEGKGKEAIRSFRHAHQIFTRQGDRVGMIRSSRELGAAYRRLGNLERAEEYLDEAGDQLGQADDVAERSLLNMEAARLAMARANHDEAANLLRSARRDLEQAGHRVEAATCVRLQARVEAERRNYGKALDLLEQARAVFEEYDDRPELDDLYDELGAIKMRTNDLTAARSNVEQSLDLGQQMGWFHGKGRSYVLLGDIETLAGRAEDARVHYEDALRAYEDAQDEVGKSTCFERLGDWCKATQDWDEALANYKDARRIFQQHRDHRGLARVFRKLGQVYLAEDELGRAEEALEQAEDYLRSDADPHERAYIQFILGKIFAARNDHNNAVARFTKARDLFDNVDSEHEKKDAVRALIDSYKMLGQADKAYECMRQLGISNAGMWQALLDELHPVVADSARNSFKAGQNLQAVQAGFIALEARLRQLAKASVKDEVSTLLNRYVQPEARGLQPFGDEKALAKFREFAIASFALLRNPIMHGDQSPMTPAEALTALSVASLVCGWLETPVPVQRDVGSHAAQPSPDTSTAP